MAIYGFIRCPELKGEELPLSQIAEMERAAATLNGELVRVFIDRNSPGGKAVIVGRPEAKEMLETFQAEDTLIVRSLDRLGYSCRDVEKTLATLAARKVHVHAIQPAVGGVDFDPALCKAILPVLALPRRIEKALRSERFTELARQRKEQGLAYGGVPTAKKIVVRDGVKVLGMGLRPIGHNCGDSPPAPRGRRGRRCQGPMAAAGQGPPGPPVGPAGAEDPNSRPATQPGRAIVAWGVSKPQPLPAFLLRSPLVPPDEVEGAIAAPLRQPGAVDRGAQGLWGGAQVAGVDAGGNCPPGTGAGRSQSQAPCGATRTVAEGGRSPDGRAGPQAGGGEAGDLVARDSRLGFSGTTSRNTCRRWPVRRP